MPSSVVKEKYKQKQTSATLLVAIPALLTLAETIASYGTGGSNDLPTIIIALKAASEVLEAA